MSDMSSVNLVVGIDFGMTCTGVAYSKPGLLEARTIQSWPGKESETHNKVPSSVVYRTKRTGERRLKYWGFKAQNVDGAIDWFKLFLDPERIRRAQFAEHTRHNQIIPDYDEIKRYYRDYMRCIYGHLSDEIQAKTGDWRSKHVAFIFSIPCSFKRPEIGNVLLELIKDAGFGTEGRRHTVELGMTEPEAAAVCTIRDSPVEVKVGTTMLVCDAGGGTTDLAILRNVTEDEDNSRIEEVNVAEAIDVGSTNIDRAFEDLVDRRLSAIYPALPRKTAWFMMQSPEFTFWKHRFGGHDTRHYRSFPIKVPTVGSDFNFYEAKIRNGRMHFSKDDFLDLFAPEVDKLIDVVSTQIESLSRDPQGFYMLDYIVLSGGLGSSSYVRHRLKETFESRKLQVLVAEHPQLAVVKGLVIDRIQKLKTGKAVLKSRKCPVSYGVELSIAYDKNDQSHYGQDCYTGLDGQRYARKQISWLIRKGDTVDPEKPIIKPCNKDFNPSDTSRTVESNIYMSENNRNDLPTNTCNADTRYVCSLAVDLTSLGLDELEAKKRPNKNLLHFKSQRYYRADFETRIFVGPADLKLEIWFKGKRYDENNVSVKWA